MVCQKCKEARDALKRAASEASKGNLQASIQNVKSSIAIASDKIKESERLRKIIRRS